MAITVVFDPPLPSDTPEVFNSKAFTLVGDLNTWSTQANAVESNVNAKELLADAAADTAVSAKDTAVAAKDTAVAAKDLAVAAEASATAAFDAFDDRYLGAKASDPTLDNDGNALITGALYFNSTVGEMRAWSGSAWTAAYLPAASYVDVSSDQSIAGTKTFTDPIVYKDDVRVISTPTTAVKARTYVLTASLTLTLPASPAAGDWVRVVNRSGVTTPVIGRNAQNIMGLAENMTLDDLNSTVTLTFADATRGWVLI